MVLGTIPTRQLDPTVMLEGEVLILLRGPSGQDGDIPVVDNVGNITWQTSAGIVPGDDLILLVGPSGQAGAVPTIDALGVISWDGSVARQPELGTRIPEFQTSVSGNIVAPGIYIVDTTSGIITLDMPNAATSGGDVYRFIRKVGVNDLIVTTVGGTDLIGTATSRTVAAVGEGFSCVDDGVGKYEVFSEIAGGFVSISGSPSDNHISVWTDSTTIEGTGAFTFDGETLAITQPAITDPAAILSMMATWNDGSDTFSAVTMNVVDTASAAASLLVDLQIGGTSVYAIGKDGDVDVAGVFERTVRTVQTTDATVTTIAQFTLPEDSSYMLDVNISGKRTDGSNTGRLMYNLRAGVYRESAGAATLQGGVQTPTTKTGGTVGAWDAIIDVTSNDFRVRINGDTGHTVEWTAVVEMIKAF